MADDDWANLTWAVLLGRWVEFARSAVALPSDGDGQRLRDSVADLIMLQAVWFALSQIDELSTEQRGVGLDRAQVLIDKHSAALVDRWADDALPPMISELIDDARTRLRETMACG